MVIDIRTKQFGRLFSEGKEPGAALSVKQRRQLREALFAETFAQRALRLGKSVTAACKMGPRALFGALDCLLRERAIGIAGLPDPAAALSHPEGLCGLVANPSPETLMEGFARGLLARELAGVLTWHAPVRRMIVRPDDFVMPAAATALLAQGALRLTLDRDFDAVVAACKPFENYSPRLMHFYAALHDMGFAHSFEVRNPFGGLVAGGFGIALGRVFVTLAMFGENDSRAIGLGVLNRHLARMNFEWHDGVGDESLAHFGFAPMARDAWFANLIANSGFGRLGRWQVVKALCGAPAPAAQTLREAA